MQCQCTNFCCWPCEGPQSTKQLPNSLLANFVVWQCCRVTTVKPCHRHGAPLMEIYFDGEGVGRRRLGCSCFLS